MTDVQPQVKEIDLHDLPGAPPDFEPCEETSYVGEQARGFAALISPTQHPITWLADAFDLWGVKYEKVSGWADRGRPPSSGSFHPNGSLLIHHTGSTSSAANPHPALGVVTKGRPDLSGPLCQISTGYDGITRIVAAGRANHAGKARAFGVNPAGDGNSMYIGNEVDTNGTQKMPQAQYDGVVLSSCAILHHYGVKPSEVADYVGLHASTSLSGKWDLGAGNGRSGVPYPRRDLCADIAARLQAGPSSPPVSVPTQEDDVTPQDIKDITDSLLAAKVIPANMLVSDRPADAKPFLIEIPRALDLLMRWALEGRDNAIVARNVAEAQATKGEALTQSEVDAIGAAVGKQLAAGFDVEFKPRDAS